MKIFKIEEIASFILSIMCLINAFVFNNYLWFLISILYFDIGFLEFSNRKFMEKQNEEITFLLNELFKIRVEEFLKIGEENER